jgi:hypothetical protein
VRSARRPDRRQRPAPASPRGTRRVAWETT